MELKIIQVFSDGSEKENLVSSESLSAAELNEWGLLETGRIIVFDKAPCVIPASDTNYLPSGKIEKTIWVRQLTNDEKKEIERRQKQMLEGMHRQQMAQNSGLVIPGMGGASMPPQQQQVMRQVSNG